MLRAHPTEVVRELALQEARRIGAGNAQGAEIVELDGLLMASIHMTNYGEFPRQIAAASWPRGLNSGTLVIYADEPREELLDAASRSVSQSLFRRGGGSQGRSGRSTGSETAAGHPRRSCRR